MIVPRGWRTTTLRRFRRVSSAHPSRSVLQLASGASPPNMLPQSRAKTAHRPSAPNLCIRNCRWNRKLSTPNLNHGQDTRANRTRHTTSSSTQSHAKRPLTSVDGPGSGEDPRPRRRPPSLTALSAPASPWRPTHVTPVGTSPVHTSVATHVSSGVLAVLVLVLVGRTVEPIEHRACE